MNVKQINQAILAGDFNSEDLRSIWDTVKLANQRASIMKTREFRIGDKVRFTGRSGRQFEGTVEKIAIKNLTVATVAGRYRVPANMLQAA
jgi:hypothetical protein